MITLQKNLFEGNFSLSQGFGEHPEWYARFGMKGHNGIDYALPTGTKLFSCLFGTVTELANDTQGYGLYIKIENDLCGVLYAHLSKTNVKVGDFVEPGRLLGYSGNTGNSTGPHLHFGVFPKPRNRQNGYSGYIDPLKKGNVEWVDKLERPEDPNQKEPCEDVVADLKASRDKWKQKTFDTEQTLATERKEREKEVIQFTTEIQKLKSELKAQDKSGQILENQKTLLSILKSIFGR